MAAKRLFMIMPFGVRPIPHAADGRIDFDALYKNTLRSAAIEAGWHPFRIDEWHGTGDIADQYLRELATSDLVLGDISAPNANVFYELGVRHSISPGGTVLIAHYGTVIPFDLAQQIVIFYDTSQDG